jgi:two-component system cell cycle response regulator
MAAQPNSRFLLACNSAALISALRPALLDVAARVDVVSSAPEVLESLRGFAIHHLVLIDAHLPGMNIEQLLAAVRAGSEGGGFPIVLISENVPAEWLERLAEGVIDDLLPPGLSASHWPLRLEWVLRAFRHGRELAHLREASDLNARTDPLTGLYNRVALLRMLFCETDRVQRMKTSLCLMLFGVDDYAHWRARLGTAGCDELLRQAVERVRRLLRSYDLFGRMGASEFALALPGCSLVNAVTLAERIRDVLAEPFGIREASVRITAGFGIASSEGRSPVVVLRDAEQALQAAQAAGPDSIRTRSQVASNLGSLTGKERLAW